MRLYMMLDIDFFVVNDARDSSIPMGLETARLVADGQWPILTTRALSGGNALVTFGQGVFDPLNRAVWALGPLLGSPRRVGLAMVGALSVAMYTGGYVLARCGIRAERLSSHLAATAMLTAPMFLVFAVPGWWNTAQGSAYFAWALAALLVVRRRFTPWRVLFLGATSWLLVASGWPHAYIAFGVACVITGVLAFGDGGPTVRHRVGALLRLALPAVGGVLAAVPVLAEYVAVSGYLTRGAAGIGNGNGFLVPSLNILFSAANPVAGGFITTGAGHTYRPIAFGFATLLILVALFFSAHSTRVWRQDRVLRILVGCAGVFYVLTQMPSNFGPFRWPIRMLAFAVIAVTAATARYLAITPRVWTRPRFAWAVVAVAVGALYASWRVPDPGADALRAVQLPLLAAVMITVSLAAYRWTRVRPVVEVALVALAVVIAWAAQPRWFNPGPPFPEESRVAQIAELAHGGFVLDAFYDRDGWATGLNSSRYLLAGISVVNGYDPIGHAGFMDLVRPRNQGFLNPDVLDRLAAPVGSMPEACWTDAMRVTVVLTQADAQEGRHDLLRACGFSPKGVEGNAALFVHPRAASDARSTVSAAAPGLSWSGDRLLSERHEQVHVKNDSDVPARLVFARQFWPGYSATLDGRPLSVSSLDGVLLAVEVPASARGVLTLTYSPTALPAGALAVGAGVAGLAATMTSAAVVQRRRGATSSEVRGRV